MTRHTFPLHNGDEVPARGAPTYKVDPINERDPLNPPHSPSVPPLPTLSDSGFLVEELVGGLWGEGPLSTTRQSLKYHQTRRPRRRINSLVFEMDVMIGLIRLDWGSLIATHHTI